MRSAACQACSVAALLTQCRTGDLLALYTTEEADTLIRQLLPDQQDAKATPRALQEFMCHRLLKCLKCAVAVGSDAAAMHLQSCYPGDALILQQACSARVRKRVSACINIITRQYMGVEQHQEEGGNRKEVETAL